MKKLLFTTILILCFSFSKSQNTAYFKVANTGYADKIERVSTGGYITIGNDSAYKLQVIRWDNNFNMMWKYKFADANISNGFPKIVEANDGNFYFMSVSLEHTGSTYIVKINSDGALVWQKIYYLASGNMNSEMLSKASGTDNGFLFGGGQCTLNNYIIKCDQDGNIVWQQQYFYPLSTGVTTCWSIIPDGNNYIVSSGYNINSLLTMKLDASGNVLSHTAYTYTGMQIVPTRIVKLNDTGGYAVMGNYNSSNNNKTEFVAIFNQALNLLTFNELTVTYDQFVLNDITAINNGRSVIVDGSIYDGSAFTIAMINISNTGSVNWKKRSTGNTVTSNKNVEFRGLTLNGNTSVHVGVGYNEGALAAIIDTNGNGLCNTMTFDLVNNHKTLTLQSQTITPAASSAIMANVSYTYNTLASSSFQLYCGTLTGIEDEKSIQTKTQVYPNPASEKCVISFPSDKAFSNPIISIVNITGQQVYKSLSTPGKSEIEIDTHNFKEGLYMVRIISGNEIIGSEKLVIIR